MIEVFIISLFYLIVGSIEDLKKHEVYDFLNYSYFSIMLIILFVNVIFNRSIMNNILGNILNIVFIVLFAFLMYYFNQWGGGDAKLMFGLSIALTLLSVKYYEFLFNLIFFGGIYSLICLFYYVIKSFNDIKKKMMQRKKIILAVFFLNIIALFFLLFLDYFYLKYFSLLLILSSTLLFLIYLAKISEEYLFKKYLKIEDLTEGDWVVDPIFYKDKKIYDPKKENGISLQTIKQLKELISKDKIKNNFLVKSGIAYFPAILLGFIFSYFGFSVFNYFINSFL